MSIYDLSSMRKRHKQAIEKIYVIVSDVEKDFEDEKPLCWSNKDGWVDLVSATWYLEDQMKSIALIPKDSHWMNLIDARKTCHFSGI
jgi:hypothetical protein